MQQLSSLSRDMPPPESLGTRRKPPWPIHHHWLTPLAIVVLSVPLGGWPGTFVTLPPFPPDCLEPRILFKDPGLEGVQQVNGSSPCTSAFSGHGDPALPG